MTDNNRFIAALDDIPKAESLDNVAAAENAVRMLIAATGIAKAEPLRRAMVHWARECDPPWDSDASLLVAYTAVSEITTEHNERLATEKREAEQAEASRLSAGRRARREAEEVAERERRENTKAAVAKRLGWSERHLFRVLSNGTTSLETAAKIAAQMGGEPQDYIRLDSRKRERELVPLFMKAAAGMFPFRSFLRERLKDTDEDDSLSEGEMQLVDNLLAFYSKHPTAPADFTTLEAFVEFLAAHGLASDAARMLWKVVTEWRFRHLIEEAVQQIWGTIDPEEI